MRELYRNLTNLPLVDVPAEIKTPLDQILDWISNATRMRNFDIEDFGKQITENPRIFNVPSSSTDTIGTEKVGDVAADASFSYVIVDNAGTLEWRRVAISSF